MGALSTTTAGKVKVNLALDPTAYKLLRELACTERGLGAFLSDLIYAEARRRRVEAEAVARMRATTGQGSPLQQALAQLEQSEARYRAALEAAGIVVLGMDGDLRYNWVGNVHPAFGFSPQQILGKCDDELFPAETAAELMALKRAVLADGQTRRGLIRVRRGNELVLYEITVEPVWDDTGRMVGLNIVAWDVTDVRQRPGIS